MNKGAEQFKFGVRRSGAVGVLGCLLLATGPAARAGQTNFFYAAEDAQVDNGGAGSWTTRASLTITPDATDEWLILATAEGWAVGGNAIRLQLYQTVPTDQTLSESAYRISGTPWPVGTTHKVLTLDAGQTYTFALRYLAHNQYYAYTTASIRNARIVAIRKNAIEWFSAEPAAAPYELSFSPAQAGDYLLIYSGEHHGTPATIHALLDGAVLDSQTRGSLRGELDQDFHAFLSFNVATLTSGVHTAALTCSVTPRRPRITAIRLTDGPFAGAVSASRS